MSTLSMWSATGEVVVYGPGWERALLDAYGVAPDDERTRYSRLLHDLGP